MAEFSLYPGTAAVPANQPQPAIEDPGAASRLWDDVAGAASGLETLGRGIARHEALQERLEAAEDQRAIWDAERAFTEGLSDIGREEMEHPSASYRDALRLRGGQVARLRERVTQQYAGDGNERRLSQMGLLFTRRERSFVDGLAGRALDRGLDSARRTLTAALDGYALEAVNAIEAGDQASADEAISAAQYAIENAAGEAGLISDGEADVQRFRLDKVIGETLARRREEAAAQRVTVNGARWSALGGETQRELDRLAADPATPDWVLGAVVENYEAAVMGAAGQGALGDPEDGLPTATQLAEGLKNRLNTHRIARGGAIEAAAAETATQGVKDLQAGALAEIDRLAAITPDRMSRETQQAAVLAAAEEARAAIESSGAPPKAIAEARRALVTRLGAYDVQTEQAFNALAADRRLSGLDEQEDQLRRYTGNPEIGFGQRDEAITAFAANLHREVEAGTMELEAAEERVREIRRDSDDSRAARLLLDDPVRLVEALSMPLSGPPEDNPPEALPWIVGEERQKRLAQATAALDARARDGLSADRQEYQRQFADYLSDLETDAPAAIQRGSPMPAIEQFAEATGAFSTDELTRMRVKEAAAARRWETEQLILQNHPALWGRILDMAEPGGRVEHGYQQSRLAELETVAEQEEKLREDDPGLVASREIQRQGGPDLVLEDRGTWIPGAEAREQKQRELGVLPVNRNIFSKGEASRWADTWRGADPDGRVQLAVAWAEGFGAAHFGKAVSEMEAEGDLPAEVQFIPFVNEHVQVKLARLADASEQAMREALPADAVTKWKAATLDRFAVVQAALPPVNLGGEDQAAGMRAMYRKFALSRIVDDGADPEDAAGWAFNRLFGDRHVFLSQPSEKALMVPAQYAGRTDVLLRHGVQVKRRIEQFEPMAMQDVEPGLASVWKDELIAEGYWLADESGEGAILYHPRDGAVITSGGDYVRMRFDGSDVVPELRSSPPRGEGFASGPGGTVTGTVALPDFIQRALSGSQ